MSITLVMNLNWCNMFVYLVMVLFRNYFNKNLLQWNFITHQKIIFKIIIYTIKNAYVK